MRGAKAQGYHRELRVALGHSFDHVGTPAQAEHTQAVRGTRGSGASLTLQLQGQSTACALPRSKPHLQSCPQRSAGKPKEPFTIRRVSTGNHQSTAQKRVPQSSSSTSLSSGATPTQPVAQLSRAPAQTMKFPTKEAKLSLSPNPPVQAGFSQQSLPPPRVTADTLHPNFFSALWKEDARPSLLALGV